MKLNRLEFRLMNNPVRAASQRWLETPALLGSPNTFKGRHVLEIGCGRGVGLKILLGMGAESVTGLDIDPEMVSLAKGQVAGLERLSGVLLGDAEAIPLGDASFDAVVDFGVLHHVPDWRRALQEVARVLRPGGAFYFEDILKSFVTAWPVRLVSVHPQATQFTADEFRSELQATGLTVTRWRQFLDWAIMGRAAKKTD